MSVDKFFDNSGVGKMKIWADKYFSLLLLSFALFSACSDDKVAGGSSDDAGIYAVKDLDVAGVSQKGPFVKGSAVTVQGIDCKTMELTHEIFEGTVKSDKGDFGVDDVNLSATCALFEVTGYYFNEVTGKKSADPITLRTITNLKNRKSVNVNVLTSLEHERVKFLVTEKGTSFAEAKKQAEEEVLVAFGVNDGAVDKIQEFENLNIFEKGDGNAALLAVSVVMQGDADVTALEKRLEKFADDFAEDGQWNDSKTKKEIAEWASAAKENGKLDTIRKNVESMNNGDKVAEFEKYVSGSAVGMTSSSNVILSSSEESNDSKSSSSSTKVNAGSEYDAAANTLKDLRDGKTYRTVTIGNQTWMAENLNYKTENSYCYNDSAENCAKYGRLYTWPDAMKVCPEGWHLPDTTEWNALLYGTVGDIAVVGIDEVGRNIRSKNGWLEQGTGGGDATDALGFTVLPGGSGDSSSYNGKGYNAVFWTATSYNDLHGYDFGVNNRNAFGFSIENKGYFGSVRCLKGEPVGASSSSSFAVSSSSVAIPISALCKTEVVDACKYGTLTDDRDGQTYKTVKIGEQWWMAENLNYYDSTDMNVKSKSWCYGADFNKDSSTCDVYGRLYSWAAAIDSVKLVSDPINPLDCGYEKECTLPSKVQGVCPSGWHLPDNDEWNVLLETVGGDSIAGNLLKAYGSGWGRVQGKGVAETDAVGFSALPAGRKRGLSSEFDDVGFNTFFWSASQDEESKNHTFAYHMELGYDQKNANLTTFNSAKDESYSVRCLKN